MKQSEKNGNSEMTYYHGGYFIDGISQNKKKSMQVIIGEASKEVVKDGIINMSQAWGKEKF